MRGDAHVRFWESAGVKFPRATQLGYVVCRLKVLFPSMGRKRIAQTLTRAGLHLSASTVGRMLKDRGRDPVRPVEGSGSEQPTFPGSH